MKSVVDNMVQKLKPYYYLPYDQTCQHEFVISAKWQKEKDYRLLVEAARDMFEYVKDYLNPEFVVEVEGSSR